jgi:predicted DNA-binding ribbon-helix-helix protein
MARVSNARGHPPNAKLKSSPHSIRPTRLKRNVRFGGKRTTIVLEPYVWDSIDAILQQEAINLDEFCEAVNAVRLHSSLAPAAQMVVLACFRILDGLHRPPFTPVYLSAPNALQEPFSVTNTVSVLPLAIRRFAQDEAHD